MKSNGKIAGVGSFLESEEYRIRRIRAVSLDVDAGLLSLLLLDETILEELWIELVG